MFGDQSSLKELNVPLEATPDQEMSTSQPHQEAGSGQDQKSLKEVHQFTWITGMINFFRKSTSRSTQETGRQPQSIVLPSENSQLAPQVTHLIVDDYSGGHGKPPRRQLPWSLLIIVILPTLLSVVYFGLIASDQYESSADYVIKTQGGGTPSSGLSGIMGAIGMGGGHGSSSIGSEDASMVEAYVGSEQILRDLSKDLDLRAIYTASEIDWFSRLKLIPDPFKKFSKRKAHRTTTNLISDEELLAYWKEKVVVKQGSAPGTSTLTVLAFTPEDAKTIADHVITLSEKLVNKVSERAQQDAVMYAQKEVELAHDRAIKAFDDLSAFQARAKQVDPTGFAKARSDIQGKMEADLSSLQSQMEALRKRLPEEAPGIQQLRFQAAALQEQLMLEKTRSTTTDHGQSATEVLNEFAKRQMETDFASKDYLSALTALESARIQANQQSRYLEAFDKPSLPDKPTLPKRFYLIATVFAFTLLLWGVFKLLVAGVREHQH
jgi:capsular polysaccharide transport system permease protein